MLAAFGAMVMREAETAPTSQIVVPANGVSHLALPIERRFETRRRQCGTGDVMISRTKPIIATESLRFLGLTDVHPLAGKTIGGSTASELAEAAFLNRAVATQAERLARELDMLSRSGLEETTS
jgi:hypothetical protein